MTHCLVIQPLWQIQACNGFQLKVMAHCMQKEGRQNRKWQTDGWTDESYIFILPSLSLSLMITMHSDVFCMFRSKEKVCWKLRHFLTLAPPQDLMDSVIMKFTISHFFLPPRCYTAILVTNDQVLSEKLKGDWKRGNIFMLTILIMQRFRINNNIIPGILYRYHPETICLLLWASDFWTFELPSNRGHTFVIETLTWNFIC